MPQTDVCKRVVYTGRVQGVGFRFTTQALAQNYAVAGYVRNQPDGTVELAAEGAQDQVAAFLQAVAARMVDYIRDQRITDEDPQGFKGFNIRH